MFELIQLEQLLAIDKYGTLSKAAQELNLSQPALSRSMQRLEKELGVTLFDRQKNKITFNENGILALDYAKKIMFASKEMKDSLQAFVKSKSTISIGSCAPAPMWILTPQLSRLFPDMSVQSEMKSFEELEKGLEENNYQIIITTKNVNQPGMICKKYCEENLYVSLPPAHPLALRKSISLSDLDGQSILLFSQVGFWFDICKEKMPNSFFLAQDNISALDELRKASALPTFATNLTKNNYEQENRVLVPLTDSEVHVTFYLKYRKSYEKQFGKIKAFN